MVCFRTKNPNLGKFLRALEGKMLVLFRAISNILRPFGIFYGHLVYFVVISYIVPQFWYVVPRKIWQTLMESNCLIESIVVIHAIVHK
jgi:hypothetical protein